MAGGCGTDAALGIKGKHGILENTASRRAFLEAPEHRIRVVYTPFHASWLNPVESQFSILARRALKRAAFRSLADLRQCLLGFIVYVNAVLAKPFRWRYVGKPLHV